MLQGCYIHYHVGSEDCAIRALEALWLYLKHLTHRCSFYVLKFLVMPIARHLLSKAKVAEGSEPYKFIMVHSKIIQL